MRVNRAQLCKELIDYALDTGNVGLFNVLTSEHKYVYIERIIKRMETLPYNKIYRLKTYRNRVRLTVSQILEDEHGVYDWNIYDREARIRYCKADNGVSFKYWTEDLGNTKHVMLYVEVEKPKERVK